MSFFSKTPKTDPSGKDKPANDLFDKDDKDKTTKTIALVLLYTFISTVAILFLTNIFIESILKSDSNKEFQKGWFDLLKNALILLGTALTTVIGYYFGQREGTIKAAQAEKKVEETDIKAANVVEKAFLERDEGIKNAIQKEGEPAKRDTPSEEPDSGIKPII